MKSIKQLFEEMLCKGHVFNKPFSKVKSGKMRHGKYCKFCGKERFYG